MTVTMTQLDTQTLINAKYLRETEDNINSVKGSKLVTQYYKPTVHRVGGRRLHDVRWASLAIDNNRCNISLTNAAILHSNFAAPLSYNPTAR